MYCLADRRNSRDNAKLLSTCWTLRRGGFTIDSTVVSQVSASRQVEQQKHEEAMQHLQASMQMYHFLVTLRFAFAMTRKRKENTTPFRREAIRRFAMCWVEGAVVRCRHWPA